jgi:hypothetical protein
MGRPAAWVVYRGKTSSPQKNNHAAPFGGLVLGFALGGRSPVGKSRPWMLAIAQH